MDRGVLGLVWACMLKFLRIGDPADEQALNFKDALLLWVQNKTASYGIKVDGWKNGFKDGLALCAMYVCPVVGAHGLLLPRHQWRSHLPPTFVQHQQASASAAQL
jgi:hypothetical protein